MVEQNPMVVEIIAFLRRRLENDLTGAIVTGDKPREWLALGLTDMLELWEMREQWYAEYRNNTRFKILHPIQWRNVQDNALTWRHHMDHIVRAYGWHEGYKTEWHDFLS